MSCLTTDGFIITGTQTGGIAVLDSHHYTMVVSTNLSKHWLRCVGGVKASSESLTHAAVYDADSSVTAVIHIHHAGLWKRLLNVYPTTSTSAGCGTVEMGNEVKRLFSETDLGKNGVLVMGGHKDGIIVFGSSLDEAGSRLLRLLDER
ncbi:MAG: class II aldolase/adducin family protein [Nanoarchaeota archaeon]|nr:class II aldolase/adducin family protein [Nanoarchaeota archaeon]